MLKTCDSYFCTISRKFLMDAYINYFTNSNTKQCIPRKRQILSYSIQSFALGVPFICTWPKNYLLFIYYTMCNNSRLSADTVFYNERKTPVDPVNIQRRDTFHSIALNFEAHRYSKDDVNKTQGQPLQKWISIRNIWMGCFAKIIGFESLLFQHPQVPSRVILSLKVYTVY